MSIFIRTEFNYDRDAASKAVGLLCDPESPDDARAHQEFKAESDINEIVRRFGLTGKLPDDYKAPMSGDFTDVLDYRSALDAVRAADAAFLEIPADIRARFGNDPQQLMAFLDDGKNRDEALKLGLIPKPPEVPRDAVAAIDELAAKLSVPKAAV